jgi:phosphoribosylanthranilate isomerase
MRVYMTGIQTMEDAKRAVDLGAVALGIRIGYKKDMGEVHPERAREIFFSLPVFVSRTGIFADEKRHVIQELVTFCRLDTLHFIGHEQPADLERYSEHVLKTFNKNNVPLLNDYCQQDILSGIVLSLDQKPVSEITPQLLGDRVLLLDGSDHSDIGSPSNLSAQLK